ncbi:MAG: ATP-dependent DNA helicase RecG [Planctomycetota bacterium]
MTGTQTSDNPLRAGTPLDTLPQVNAHRARALDRLGLRYVGDLLRHLPTRYEAQAAEGSLADLPTDQTGSARGEITSCRFVQGFGFGKKSRFEATLTDDSATVQLVWFGGGYLRDKLHPGLRLRVTGKVRLYNDKPQLVNPKFEILPPEEDPEAEQPTAATERLRPVYPATSSLTSQQLEALVNHALPRVLPTLEEPLPADLLKHHNMPGIVDAYRMAHTPAHADEAKAARRRLAFNELLLLQLGIALKKSQVDRMLVAPELHWSDPIDQHLRDRFPFKLTDAQNKVISEIAADLQKPRPMNRLLQGDVGAGKTIIAAYAMLLAVADRRQAALLAPTELLAEQHYASLSKLLEGSSVQLELLTAHTEDKSAARARLANGSTEMVVGTHALLSDSVRFKDLAVAVVDEQHRFGVRQRANFRSGDTESLDGRLRSPHTLVMTATPIPRTLALTVFGDLDVSTIHGLPPGRSPIINRRVTPDQSDEVYTYLAKRVANGEQAYVVVPTVEEGLEAASGQKLASVAAHAKQLAQHYFQGHEVATVHGRLKPETRHRVMQRFREGKVDVLVATTVIEVGVDVPNATLMAIEHAERFGLAQLHQLRGRIGRGTHGRKSLCVFIADPQTEDGEKRIDAITSTNDGFRIAELDAEIRGFGDLAGTRQSGALPLRVADLPKDFDLLRLAKTDAEAITAEDPELTSESNALLRRVLMQQMGHALGLVDVG